MHTEYITVRILLQSSPDAPKQKVHDHSEFQTKVQRSEVSILSDYKAAVVSIAVKSILTPITPYYLLAKLCWMDVHARTLQRSRNKAQLRCAAVRTVRECSPFWQTDSRDYRLPSFLLYVRWVYGQKVLVFRLTVSSLFFVPFFKVLCHPF